MLPQPPHAMSPTRALVETSAGVRAAARNLTKVSIRWDRPKQVLVVTKPDDTLIPNARLVADYFEQHEHGIILFIEDTILANTGGPPFEHSCVRPWNAQELMTNQKPHAHEIDFVITLGGDGTVLYASCLFQQLMPPILPFHLGTLGFLTVFDFSRYEEILNHILGASGLRLSDPSTSSSVNVNQASSGLRIVLRMRLNCNVYRKKSSTPDHPDATYQILNDLVVDRGPSPYMSLLEVFGNEQHLTTVQADGLVVSTPTGSTAYSLSAGGSMVHPEVPAILLTPICPHTLSFRPMLLPDSMELKIVVPKDARNVAWASFDGRNRTALEPGDTIIITPSRFPVPTLCKANQTQDWFESLVRCLGWNERMTRRQRAFGWRTTGHCVNGDYTGSDSDGEGGKKNRDSNL